MNILNRTFKNIKTGKGIKRQCHSSSSDAIMFNNIMVFVPACICSSMYWWNNWHVLRL